MVIGNNNYYYLSVVNDVQVHEFCQVSRQLSFWRHVYYPVIASQSTGMLQKLSAHCKIIIVVDVWFT